jgi:hypothetical protein
LRRAGRQTRVAECTVVEQVEVHADGSIEVVGFKILGPGTNSASVYGANHIELLRELIAKRRTRGSR